MPPLRGPLRQGRVPGGVPRAGMSLRLRVRSVGAHLHRVHAEGVRRRDRPRPARGGGAATQRLRRREARRAPLPMCRVEISSCYEHRADELGCRNPEFFEVAAATAELPRLRAARRRAGLAPPRGSAFPAGVGSTPVQLAEAPQIARVRARARPARRVSRIAGRPWKAGWPRKVARPAPDQTLADVRRAGRGSSRAASASR